MQARKTPNVTSSAKGGDAATVVRGARASLIA
jgi:hypothetical protein